MHSRIFQIASRPVYTCRAMHHNGSATRQLVLYDVPSQDPCQAWSPNAWKIRLLLNYKNLDYRTEWTELPALESALSKHVPPNVLGPSYTVPAIRFEDNLLTMGSEQLAEKICTRWPSPVISLHSSARTVLDKILPDLYRAISGVYIPLVPQRLLRKAGHEFWHKTREARFGMSLERLQSTTDPNTAWRSAEPYLEGVTQMLLANKDGPYFDGASVSYADFIWAGFLIYMKRIGADIFERLLLTSGDRRSHCDLLEAVSLWSKRSSW